MHKPQTNSGIEFFIIIGDTIAMFGSGIVKTFQKNFLIAVFVIFYLVATVNDLTYKDTLISYIWSHHNNIFVPIALLISAGWLDKMCRQKYANKLKRFIDKNISVSRINKKDNKTIVRVRGINKKDVFENRIDIQESFKKTITRVEENKKGVDITLSNGIPKCVNWYSSRLKNDNDFMVNVGISSDGEFNIDFERHTLIVGTTGSGKSVLTNSIIYQLLSRGIDLYCIDFKDGIELVDWEQYSKSLCMDIQSAHQTLSYLKDLCSKRNRMMKGKVKNLKQWNEKYPNESMKRTYIVIDEIVELVSTKGKKGKEKEMIEEILSLIESIARLGRSAGIYMICATQIAKREVLPAQIMGNIVNRFCGAVETNHDSSGAIGVTDATKIDPDLMGRFMFTKQGKNLTEFQAYKFETSDIKLNNIFKGE